MSITTSKIIVRLGTLPEEGALLLLGRELLAMVVWLAPDLYANDLEIAGKWSLELGFGACAFRKQTILFNTLDEAVAWASQRIQSITTSSMPSHQHE